MNEQERLDAVEELVARRLDHEANTVDGGALLDRVRRTRRMRRIRRQVAAITAMAAVVALAVTGFLMTQDSSPTPSPMDIGPGIARVIQGQQEQVTGGIETIMSATDYSLTNVFGGLPAMIQSDQTLGLNESVGEIKMTLETDVKEIRSKVGTFVSDSLGKAGLFI